MAKKKKKRRIRTRNRIVQEKYRFDPMAGQYPLSDTQFNMLDIIIKYQEDHAVGSCPSMSEIVDELAKRGLHKGKTTIFHGFKMLEKRGYIKVRDIRVVNILI